MTQFFCGPYLVTRRGDLYEIRLAGKLVGRGASRPSLADCLWLEKFGSSYVLPEHIRRSTPGWTAKQRKGR